MTNAFRSHSALSSKTADFIPGGRRGRGAGKKPEGDAACSKTPSGELHNVQFAPPQPTRLYEVIF